MAENAFDENEATKAMDQYSRQIGTIGVEAMKSLAVLDALVVGVKGAGVETAKNLALLGARSVTIADDELVEIGDLGTNYWLREEHVGKVSRAAAVMDEMKRLNPYCSIEQHTGAIDTAVVQRFSAVVVTSDLPQATLEEWGAACHDRTETTKDAGGNEVTVRHPVLFIVAVTNGLTASIFVDIGNESVDGEGNPAHRITDANGESLITNVVDKVEYVEGAEGKEATVEVTTNALLHNYDDGDLVSFNEVAVAGLWEEGREQKEQPRFAVKRLYREVTEDDGSKRTMLVGNRFSIPADGVAPFDAYTAGGFVTEVKKVVFKSFRPFAESVVNPLTADQFMFPYHDQEQMFMKNRGAQLHFARRALWRFQQEKGALPALHSTEDADACVAIAQALLADAKSRDEKGEAVLTVDEVDVEVVRKAALYARVELPSFGAILGGIAAQEAVKMSGKYTPLRQWQHFDELVLVEDEVAADAKPQGTRYDNILCILGQAAQEKIWSQKWFLVGCGALGCEYMKAMALMGLGARGGYVTVTDNDRIELSNLNRQFLFRPEDVGKPKSLCGRAAALRMNSEMVVKSLEEKVCPETEKDVFTHAFWADLDGVWNALDNVKARQYTDSKIVFHEKVLLESGTLGTQANSETIVPFKTKSYNDYKEQTMLTAIPMCTLKLFPHLIDHCIEWARAEFNDVFADAPRDANAVIKDARQFVRDMEGSLKPAVQYKKLKSVQALLEKRRTASDMAGCVQMAMDYFLLQFRNRILDLTHTLPRDHIAEDPVTKERKPFWTGGRRFPTAAEFDADNEQHLAFVHCCANLFAFMFGVPQVPDEAEFKAVLAASKPAMPAWEPPKEDVHVETDTEAEDDKEAEKEAAANLDGVKQALLSADFSGVVPFEAAEFEKDDDTNFHIDFMSTAANMRAWNYSIKQASRFKVKMIAGRITPALATTTAMITGFVLNDFYKLIVGRGLHMGTNVNLATGEFQSFEMEAPHKAEKKYDPEEGEDVVPVPDGWATWDKVVVEATAATTVKEFVSQIPAKHHDCECVMLYGKGQKVMMHNRLAQGGEKKRLAQLATRPLKEVIGELYGEPTAFYRLEGSFEKETEDGADVFIASIPPLFVHFTD